MGMTSPYCPLGSRLAFRVAFQWPFFPGKDPPTLPRFCADRKKRPLDKIILTAGSAGHPLTRSCAARGLQSFPLEQEAPSLHPSKHSCCTPWWEELGERGKEKSLLENHTKGAWAHSLTLKWVAYQPYMSPTLIIHHTHIRYIDNLQQSITQCH